MPDNILNCCEIVHVPRPSKTIYNKCLKNKLSSNLTLNSITNIKNLREQNDAIVLENYKIICDKIIDSIKNVEDLKFLKFRDMLYDILIYNLDITDCVWYILSILIKENKIKQEHISAVLIKTYSFFQYYNNNYRPIYHLESYLFYITTTIHNFS
jgi:hypothetical protein